MTDCWRVRFWLGVLVGLGPTLAAADPARPRSIPEEQAASEVRPTATHSPQRSVRPIEDQLLPWQDVLESEDGTPGELIETQPVQYPLENDIFEGRDPDGRPFSEGEFPQPDWREESVIHAEPCVPEVCRPLAEWSSTRWTFDVLPRTEDGIGFTNIEARGTIKFPRAPFVWISPRFAWHFLNGPVNGPRDVPNQVYDASLDTTFAWKSQDDVWLTQLVIAPGVFSDFENTSDGFRLTGRAIALYRWNPQTQLLFGASYLGRDDLPWVPALGVIYVPTESIRYEISLPRPRVAFRYYSDGDRERWAYVAGELGGGTWSVRRAGGVNDVMTYRDLQFVGGIEHKEASGFNWQCEAGWVFARRLEWESTIGDRDLSATGLVRLTMTF